MEVAAPGKTKEDFSIELDNEGGRKMNAVTKDNVGRAMAILFIEQKPRVRKVMVDGEEVEEFYSVEDKRLISVANIQSALGFNFRITGLDLREAQDLALLLRWRIRAKRTNASSYFIRSVALPISS